MSERPALPPALRLHQLEGFYYVATYGGYARARAEMPFAITEPALHQQVRKLERALGGGRLLERGPRRRMVLTPAGRAIYEVIAPTFEALPSVLRDVSRDASGVLILAADALYIGPLCAPAVAALRREVPRLRLRLQELDRSDIVAGVLDGRIDLGLSVLLGEEGGCEEDELGEMGLELLLPEGHPLLEREGPLRPEWVEGLEVAAYPPESEAGRMTAALLARFEVALEPIAEATTAAAMAELVRAGVGAAFVPALRRGQERRVERGLVAWDVTESLRERAEPLRFGLLRRPVELPSKLLRRLIAALREVVASWER